jgi:Na+/H+ antiporter NhaD/arsenite permease-like protein
LTENKLYVNVIIGYKCKGVTWSIYLIFYGLFSLVGGMP